MDVDSVLCNHAEVADGKLYINGAGIHMSFVGPEPPHAVTLGLGLVIHVPYQLTNEPHTASITLVDEDGAVVTPWSPPGADVPNAVNLTLPFNIGRPPFVERGDDQSLPLAVNFVNIGLPHLGRFSFSVKVDGTEVARQSFRAQLRPAGFGFGAPQAA